MKRTSRFEYFLQFVGMWFLAIAVVWSVRAVESIGDMMINAQQFVAVSILAVLGVLIALAAFLSGIRSLYCALKE